MFQSVLIHCLRIVVSAVSCNLLNSTGHFFFLNQTTVPLPKVISVFLSERVVKTDRSMHVDILMMTLITRSKDYCRNNLNCCPRLVFLSLKLYNYFPPIFLSGIDAKHVN